ncbi:DALR anticodon-binding domain-containing protein [Nocardiopsis trehalosi]|uniref:DALR anticodon-binding domain-containing protein n=1 Tax=Nocardiopsis trehalosi TaxID=109329 RepID=UPI0014709A19|nr:DALR anticodon-binding domain-containing protein [Nocardiopsis trehalosi]
MAGLLRAAAAEVVGPGVAVPPADPRRPPADASGHVASALPLRLAGAARRDPGELAAEMAAVLRSRPEIADAVAHGRGFVNVTLTPRALIALVRSAARDPLYLVGGGRAADGCRTTPEVPAGGGSGRGLSGLPPVSSAVPGAASDPWDDGVGAARDRVRAEVRRRIAAAADAVAAVMDGGVEPGADAGECADSDGRDAADARWPGEVEGAGGGSGAVPDVADYPVLAREVSWRDPWSDGASGAGEAARLLAAVGEANARYAFCRSASDRLRPGEATGAGLPALPTADAPGNWGRYTDDNPAFAVRYAHAHAVSSLRWARDEERAGGGAAARSGEGIVGVNGGSGVVARGAGAADGTVGRGGGSEGAEAVGGAVGCGIGPGRADGPYEGGDGALVGEGGSSGGGGEGVGLGAAAGTGTDADVDAGGRVGTLGVEGAGLGVAGERLAGWVFDGPVVVRASGRRDEPHMLVRYLEGLAIAYHEWRESRGGATGAAGAPATGGAVVGEDSMTRLDLCAAVAGVLATGLSLLGVSAPTRL